MLEMMRISSYFHQKTPSFCLRSRRMYFTSLNDEFHCIYHLFIDTSYAYVHDINKEVFHLLNSYGNIDCCMWTIFGMSLWINSWIEFMACVLLLYWVTCQSITHNLATNIFFLFSLILSPPSLYLSFFLSLCLSCFLSLIRIAESVGGCSLPMDVEWYEVLFRLPKKNGRVLRLCVGHINIDSYCYPRLCIENWFVILWISVQLRLRWWNAIRRRRYFSAH